VHTPVAGDPGVVYSYTMNSRDVIRLLEEAGWRLARTAGSHHHFRHPDKPGLVTVPHPKKTLPKGTLKNIARQSGLTLEWTS